MNVNDYSNIGKDIEIPGIVAEKFNLAMDKIKEDSINVRKIDFGRNIAQYAVMAAAVILLVCTTTVSVKAYRKHIATIKNMPNEEVVSLYEDIYKYDKGLYSRDLSKAELEREDKLYDDYYNDIAEPVGKVTVIDNKSQYTGKGVAFCKGDGLLYIPDKDMTDEEFLECIEFGLIGHYIDKERYEEAINPDHYMNMLRALNDAQIDELYVSYCMGGTECALYSRELSSEETASKKALKKLYKVTETKPKKQIEIIKSESDYTGSGVAFCTENCTYMLPEGRMSDEDILEIVDYEIKQVYAITRIGDEINDGIRTEWPHVDVVRRERIQTLDTVSLSDTAIMSMPWMKAYGKVISDNFENLRNTLTDPADVKDYCFNVRFIYLNDDDIPEMLLSYGYTQHEGIKDMTDKKIYLYTVKNDSAVMLKSDFGEGIGYYAQFSSFKYAERKSMVYNEGHYMYQFMFEPYHSEDYDNISDLVTRMDYWDLETLTCTHTDMNISLKHAVYDYEKEAYEDAEVSYEYYLGVREITRDDYTGVMDEIKGQKVDEATYNAANEALWNGEQYITVTAADYDKIYSDYDTLEALAKCYEKQMK